MINQNHVREAEKLLTLLQAELRILYEQAIGNQTKQTRRDAKMTMAGMCRGMWDFIEYCKSGE